jgi:hypothetical protein
VSAKTIKIWDEARTVKKEHLIFVATQHDARHCFLEPPTAKNRMPAISRRGDFFESGSVKSYRPEQAESITRVTSMVDTIDLPVE